MKFRNSVRFQQTASEYIFQKESSATRMNKKQLPYRFVFLDETLAKKIIRVEPKRANNLMKKVERSFIPLMTSAPKRKIVRSICHPKTSKVSAIVKNICFGTEQVLFSFASAGGDYMSMDIRKEENVRKATS